MQTVNNKLFSSSNNSCEQKKNKRMQILKHDRFDFLYLCAYMIMVRFLSELISVQVYFAEKIDQNTIFLKVSKGPQSLGEVAFEIRHTIDITKFFENFVRHA